MKKALIDISHLSKTYGTVNAVDDVSLTVFENEFVALLGPSGCGKTTLLRMLAGLEYPSDGHITIDGISMDNVPPNRRPVNMVFQSYAVFPHMTVAQNVAYGLKVTGTPAARIRSEVAEALDMVQLSSLADRRPAQMSGGQRQRVALARALVKRPRVLLLDEPLSALDAKLREQMQLELARLQQSLGITFVVVTHDQNEALSMASRVAVMREGKLAQVATPHELYDQPASRFVADFIGRANFLNGQLSSVDHTSLGFNLADFGEVDVPWHGNGNNGAMVGAVLAIRPEHIIISTEPPADSNLPRAQGTVTGSTYYGDSRQLYVQTAGKQDICATLRSETMPAGFSYANGERVWISWDPAYARPLSDTN